MRHLLLALCLSTVMGEDVPTPDLTVPPLDDAHANFAAVLAACVKPDGVDYAALRRDPAPLDRYRVQLAHAELPADGAGRKALLINAYNACTLALVAPRLPQDRSMWASWSIRSLGGTFTSVWKSYTFEVAGRRMTLDQIEHRELRPLGDPRIHVAINCASRSCPTLAAAPYLATTLDAQLDAAAAAFCADPRQVRLVDGGVQINPILSWFADDFAAGGGVHAWLLARLPAGPVHDRLTADGRLGYFSYDWTLNQTRMP